MKGLNTDQLKKGDKVTVRKWLKKLGKIPVEHGGKLRNALALCQKGKLIVAIRCEGEEAETIVNDEGKLVPYKRISLDAEVKFAESMIEVFPIDLWKKATTKNLFMGMLDQFKEQESLDTLMEQQDGLDSGLPVKT